MTTGGEDDIVQVAHRYASPAAEGQPTEGTASGALAAVHCTRWLGIVYRATLARAAQARAIKEIDRLAAIGRRRLMRSRKRALAVSSSDMA